MNQSNNDYDEKSKELTESSADFFFFCIQTLHECIKEFSFNLNDIGADGFKKQIDLLVKDFISTGINSDGKKVFTEYKGIVDEYRKKEKKYFDEKEIELKNIIELLTNGLTTFNNENIQFNKEIHEHSDKFLDINHIDNIKKIKEVLELQVSNIKNTIKKKEDDDNHRIESLTEKIATLQADLQKAEIESTTDRLTGAHNRLAFDFHMKKLIGNDGLRWTSFSVLMCDIDDFKKVNDTYGHLVGDRVIVRTVEIIKTFFRKNDFIARYGGEEFVVILHAISLKNATKKAFDICRAIEKNGLVLDEDKPDEKLSFTLSIGASTQRDDDTVLSIIDRADKALYHAKRTGKNRACNEKDI